MSVVRINALEVPPEMADTLESRFATRAGEVETMDGFEGFELLRPTDGSTRYFVYTRWRDEAAFQAWVDSQQFQHGHARAGGGHSEGGDSEGGATSSGGGQSPHGGPAATGSELLAFDVVLATGQSTGSTSGADEEE